MQQEDYELISSYLDDELDQEARAKVEQRLSSDDEFAQMFANFDTQDTQIKDAYTEIDNKPLPDELQALLFDKPQIEAHELQQNVIRPPTSVWKKWMPLAASIAIAAVLAPIIIQQVYDDRLTVAKVLDSYESGETYALSNKQDVFLSMSFEDAKGNWCREFYTASGDMQKHKIACLKNDAWEVMVEVDAPFPAADVYAPASGGSSMIDAWLDDNMATDSLTKEQEQLRLKR